MEEDIHNPAAAMPPALRERVGGELEQLEQALTKATADPELAGAAYLYLGQLALANGDRGAAIANLQAAVASGGDGAVVYQAARRLLAMPYVIEDPHASLAPYVWGDSEIGDAASTVVKRADPGGGMRQGSYSAEMHSWCATTHSLVFRASPYAILAYLHSQPWRTRLLPALESFYATAVEMGYCASDPMPQVRQLLGLASSPGVPMRRMPLKYAPHIA